MQLLSLYFDVNYCRQRRNNLQSIVETVESSTTPSVGDTLMALQSSNEGQGQPLALPPKISEHYGEEPGGADVPRKSFDLTEPTYCVCDQVSYGDMVACDSKDVRLSLFMYSRKL